MSTFQPIIIVAPPRSGSSMVASIFAANGVWCGEHPLKRMSNTPVPYPSFENKAIESVLRLGGRIADAVPDDCLWFFKGGPRWAWLILAQYPDAKIVKVKRKQKSILASSDAGKKHGRIAQIKQVDKFDGPYIDSDEILKGDLSSIAEAFDYCGLRLDEGIAKKCIHPDLWHHW